MDDLADSIRRHSPSQNPKELAVLVGELQEINPLVILEIGMDRGGSMMVWSEQFDPALLIGLDIVNPKHDVSDAENIFTIKNDSHSYAVLNQIKKRLADDHLDFLFIDGDHSYEGVKKDFEMYAPLVRDGGIIAFHDIMVDPKLYPEGEVDVKTFWNELKNMLEGPQFADWDYKEIWDEAGQGTGTGIVFVGSR